MADLIQHVTIKGVTYDLPSGGSGAVSSVNGQTGDVVLDADDVGALPDSTAIPTKTSDLQNDSGFITGYTETDPTVPSWAKQSTKPSYTAQEVGALPSSTVIPSKVSQLQNDSGYLTTETDPTVPSWAKASSKPTYTASEVGALPNNTVIPEQNSWYGTCTETASTAAKTVTTTSGDFELTTGNSVLVRFSNGNTSASATLNVDSTGAVNIRRNGTTNSPQYMWGAGEIVHLVYDGTYFLIVEGYRATTDYYGVTKLNSSTNSSSETEAATPLAVKTVADQTYSFTGSSGSVSVTGTPSGSVSAPTISVDTAGSTSNAATEVTAAAPGATAPSNAVTYYSYDSATSTLKLYQIGYNTSSFRTGDASYTASTPTFTGSSTTSTGTFTPSGSVTKD